MSVFIKKMLPQKKASAKAGRVQGVYAFGSTFKLHTYCDVFVATMVQLYDAKVELKKVKAIRNYRYNN